MDEITSYWNGLSEPVQTTALLLGLVLLVLLGQWVGLRFRRGSRRRASHVSGNAVPMQRSRRGAVAGGSRKSRLERSVNPLWLVLLAIGLLVGFRSGIWTELRPHQTISGVVTHVRDGDTIEVNHQAIRLNGLTCDERGSPLGDRATEAMRQIVSGGEVTCELNGDRTYDREVGRCALADGRDLGALMIGEGLCGRCARYDPLRTYAGVQREAGAFEGDNPEYCWALW